MEQNIKQRKVAIYTTIEVFAVLVITILGNGWDWVNLTFSMSELTKSSFWSNVVIQTLMYSSALLVGYLIKIEKEELKSSIYKDLLSNYREILKNKKDSFNIYVDEYLNPSIKKKFIKERAQRKLYRLDRYSKDEWKLDYQRRNEEGFEYLDKKSKRYCEKRERLEKLASDEYIDKNYQFISIKYPRINAQAFTYYLFVGVSERDEYKVENETIKELPIKMFRKVLICLFSSMIIGTIIWDPSVNELLQQANGWISLMIKYVLRISLVIVNLYMGLYLGKNMFERNFLLPIQNRIRILKDYITWKKDNGEETAGDKILEAYENQKEVSSKLKEQIKQLTNIKEKQSEELKE